MQKRNNNGKNRMDMVEVENETWLLCPTCGNKTRVKIRSETVLENFPLSANAATRIPLPKQQSF